MSDNDSCYSDEEAREEFPRLNSVKDRSLTLDC